MHVSRDQQMEHAASRVKAGSTKRRWVRVRVLTDETAYVGRLRLESTRTALHDLIADGRAYLGLWDAAAEGSAQAQEFVAIHKSAIRAVILLEQIGAARAAA